MNNSTISNINNSTFSTTSTDINNNNKIFKQIWQLGKKHLVVIDESIIKKLDIKNEEENSTTFVEQELTSDNTIILMRISKI